jgi:1,4-alpha-glucan branching enzyme
MNGRKMVRRRVRDSLKATERFIQPLLHFLRPTSPSPRSGMGAIAHEDGIAFRVWAPHADRVSVSGTFNRWSRWRTPLAREAGGTWSADVARARPGDEYKFLIGRRPQLHSRTDPYARAVSFPDQNGIITNGHSRQAGSINPLDTEFQMSARQELIIYELHVGTFYRKPEEKVGSFQGVIEKLPYLYGLGINVIELMPVAEFAGDFSWGYNPAHPFAIAQAYGGAEGLKALVRAAHTYHIAVIVDVVYNHFGPDNLSLWQFDGWHEHGKGGIYFYNDWRSKTPWADTRPDYGRPEVRHYIRDNVMMWFEEYGVDGLRWDATAYIRNAHGWDRDSGSDIPDGWRMLQEINEEVNRRYPGKISIAEDLRNNEWLTNTTEAGGAGFDCQWDARFVHPLREAVITADDAHRDMFAVSDAIRFRYNDDALRRVIYSESHDEVANGKARVPEHITPGDAASFYAKKRAALAAVIVFASPGIPMIFQGQEFVEEGWFDDRVPLDWRKAELHRGIIHLYRSLIRLRRNGDGNSRGLSGQHVNVYHIDNENKLIAFHRWHLGGLGDDVVVVANFANRTVEKVSLGFPHPGLWRVRLNSDWRHYDVGFNDHRAPAVKAVAGTADGMAYRADITLGPYSAVFFSQDGLEDE